MCAHCQSDRAAHRLLLTVQVEPTAVLADEAGTLVQHTDGTGARHVGGAELDHAARVVRRASDDVHDLQAPPSRVAVQIDGNRTRRAVPGREQPFDVRCPERLEPRPHESLGGRRPFSFVHPDILTRARLCRGPNEPRSDRCPSRPSARMPSHSPRPSSPSSMRPSARETSYAAPRGGAQRTIECVIRGLPKPRKKMPGWVWNLALTFRCNVDQAMASVPVRLSLTKKIAPPPSLA